jgi:hypothetical protein
VSSLISELEQVTEGALANGVGFGLALTAAPALTPLATALRQTAFTADPNLAPDVYQLAAGVAQGQVDPAAALDWAHKHGISDSAFAALVQIANTGPPLGLAFEAWRRGTLSTGDFQDALNRAAIEPRWWPALRDLKTSRLDLGAIATAVHRGIMADSGLLVTPVPGGSGTVPRIPVSSLDTLAEFAAHGVDPERARVLVADTGLPLALGEMLQLYNRNKVSATDVKVSIAESNVRNEYMDVALDLARRLLTPHEYAEAELRGVLSPQEAVNGAGLSGIDPADYATLFAILGRPLSIHQVTTGLARGGTYGGTYSDVPAGPYRDAIRRSAVRPEYASLDYANRFSYPSGFQIKSEAADLGKAQTQQLLLEVGWSPHWADVFSTKWSGAGTGAAAVDPHVKKAQSSLFTEAHKAYVKVGLSQAQVTPALTKLAVSPADQQEVFSLWDVEKQLAAEVPAP